ncbi:hypothetical protein AB5J62_17175 [Amycolatopsis sp. cg5]|uniref:hypothetical protein n=1 Tax=Amycolatopsis sp. cg5 TaxID=3238802 RepID=UPI0035240B33
MFAAVLEGFGSSDDRVAAAVALRSLPLDPRSLAALHRGMLGQDPRVRHECAKSLLCLAGRPEREPAIDDDPDELLGAFAVRTAGLHGDRATFAVELGPADYAAPHHRTARIYLAGARLSGPDRSHVPTLCNIGVYTTYPDRAPDYPNLRRTLEDFGFGGLPESVTLDVTATAATLDAVAEALEFDMDVSRWRATEILIGDRSRLALEIGPSDGTQLRTCTLWLDGVIATPFDNTAYVPQFAHSLRLDAAAYQAGRMPDFARWGPTTDGLDTEWAQDGTLRYRLPSPFVREGALRLNVDEIVAVLEAAADVLTAG